MERERQGDKGGDTKSEREQLKEKKNIRNLEM